MRIVLFGLSVTSSWGNGHATLLRSLFEALHEQGHEVLFFERDTEYYSAHRDAPTLPYADVHLYASWEKVWPEAQQALARADVGIVTSYCPDGRAACDLVANSNLWRKVFYDMDTPVTLSRLGQGETVDYVPPGGFGLFDMVLSYTGGAALEQLSTRLGARRTAPLYGWVSPKTHYPTGLSPMYAADISYLGTYAQDRQQTLQQLFIEPAAQLSRKSFVIGGAMYPSDPLLPCNIRVFDHVAPPDHSAFYCSSPLTLNVTRGSMAAMGFCPSGRLFEAAACGTAVLSDWWPGLNTFFEPGEEILIASTTAEAIDAVTHDRGSLKAIGQRARQRTLACHTSDMRARRLIDLLTDLPDEMPLSQPLTLVSKAL